MELFLKEEVQEKTKNSGLKKLETKIKKKFFLRHLLEWEVFASMIVVAAMIFLGVKSTVAVDAVKKMIPDNLLVPQIASEPEEEEPVAMVDTSAWETYSSKVYGFQFKYPNNWEVTIPKQRTKGASYSAKFMFRNNQLDEQNPLAGFDVAVYDAKLVSDLNETDEVIGKIDETKNVEACQDYKEHVREISSSPVVGVKIAKGDICFEPVFFLNATSEYYSVNIVPIARGDKPGRVTSEQMRKFMPELESVAGSFEFIKIVAPKPRVAASSQPSFNVQRPISAKKIGDRYYCAKKKDKPRKSKQNPKGHLDLQCCLDPDEIPNPWCVY